MDLRALNRGVCGLLGAFAIGVPAATAAPSARVAPIAVQAYADGVARAWLPRQTPGGAFADTLATARVPAPAGYGEVMLASVLLSGAQRTGDPALAAAASSSLRARIAGPPTTDPFTLLGAATAARDLRRSPAPAGFRAPLAEWLATYAPPAYDGVSGQCLAQERCYNNWKLVWTAAAATLLQTPSGGAAGSLLSDPNRTRARAARYLALATKHAGPVFETPVGLARSISDPSGRPPAYHVLAAYLLDRTLSDAPQLATPAAVRLRDQSARYVLAMMAPTGALTWSGRSMDQSWVQAAAAALGARRAAAGGPGAARWRSLADRSLQRLQTAYPKQPDGTLLIVPGLRDHWSAAILDPYAGMLQYNGLTAFLVSDAAAHWPEPAAPRAGLPTDSQSLVSDPAAGLAWGQADGVFWSFGLRHAGADKRDTGGLVALQALRGDRWEDRLALRPRSGTSTSLVLRRGSRRATLLVDRVDGTGRLATLTGRWRAAGQTLGPARVTLRVSGGGVTLSTMLSPTERLSLAVYTPATRGAVTAFGPKARVRTAPCVTSASGTACPMTASYTGGGTARLRLR